MRLLLILVFVSLLVLNGCSTEKATNPLSDEQLIAEISNEIDNRLYIYCDYNDTLSYWDTQEPITHEYIISNLTMEDIRDRPQYIVDEQLFLKIIGNSTKPVVCDIERRHRTRWLDMVYPCNEKGKKYDTDTLAESVPAVLVCCFEEYCTERKGLSYTPIGECECR